MEQIERKPFILTNILQCLLKIAFYIRFVPGKRFVEH